MEKAKRNGRVSVIAAVILCVIFIPVILINTIMIIKTFTDPEHLPGILGIKPAIVLSGSMSPLFEKNALIFVKETDTAQLKENDVICFMQDGAATTHRIDQVVVTDGQVSYITKGDANNTTDRLPVTPDQIEGIYIGHVAGLGGVAMFMQSTAGMIVFIVLPVVLYLAFDIISRKRDSSQEKDRTAELEAELAALKAKNEQPATQEAVNASMSDKTDGT